MAIRTLLGKKSPYVVYWINPFSGKQESRSFSSLPEAEKHDAFIKYHLKYERDIFKKNEKEEEKKNKEKRYTFECIFYEYLKDKKHDKTVFLSIIRTLRKTMMLYGDMPVSELTSKDIKILLKKNSEGVKKSTARTRMTMVKAVLRWAVKNGFLEKLPEFPEQPRNDYEHFIPPTPSEIRKMLHVAAPHIQRVIILGTQLGVRVGPSEMFKLRWDNIDFERNVVRVRAANKNKNEPWREIPLRKTLVEVLHRWKTEDAGKYSWLVHYGQKDKPIGLSIQGGWRTMLKRAGITRRIRPYDLRHAFATEAICAGTDIGTLSSLMGHTSPMMILKHYQHVTGKAKRSAVEALPDIPNMYGEICTEQTDNHHVQ